MRAGGRSRLGARRSAAVRRSARRCSPEALRSAGRSRELRARAGDEETGAGPLPRRAVCAEMNDVVQAGVCALAGQRAVSIAFWATASMSPTTNEMSRRHRSTTGRTRPTTAPASVRVGRTRTAPARRRRRTARPHRARAGRPARRQATRARRRIHDLSVSPDARHVDEITDSSRARVRSWSPDRVRDDTS